jgi:retron-type reverse transcriptase
MKTSSYVYVDKAYVLKKAIACQKWIEETWEAKDKEMLRKETESILKKNSSWLRTLGLIKKTSYEEAEQMAKKELLNEQFGLYQSNSRHGHWYRKARSLEDLAQVAEDKVLIDEEGIVVLKWCVDE